jgi:hypothetical protein
MRSQNKQKEYNDDLCLRRVMDIELKVLFIDAGTEFYKVGLLRRW